MPIKIQIRRGTASQWTSSNPTLSLGEIGYETDTKKIKVGDGTTAWTSLIYSTEPIPSQTSNSGKYLTTNGSALSWSAVDAFPSQTGNANKVLTTNATSTSWTNLLTNLISLSPEERWNIVASAATGTINIDALTSTVWHYTSNASANHTINVRGNSSTTLSSLLAVGDSITVVWAINNGTTAYYPTTIQVDGSAVTPKWLNGTSLPTAAQANQTAGIDAFTLTIVKTASTPTYTVLGSWAQYK